MFVCWGLIYETRGLVCILKKVALPEDLQAERCNLRVRESVAVDPVLICSRRSCSIKNFQMSSKCRAN